MFLNLAQRVARELFSNFETPGDFEGCELFAAPRFKSGRIDGAVAGNHIRNGNFASNGMGFADHCSLRDLRLLGKIFFDLPWINIETA
jgi:hypothetical protein